jgi:hypothetical protein
LSGYFGDTQSTLYDGIDKDDDAALARADSSVVGIAMIGLDARYYIKGLQLRGQLYRMHLSNTGEYNSFTAKSGVPNDLGSLMTGYYVEAGYNVLRFVEKTETELIPFVRLEGYDTHADVSGIARKDAYRKFAVTSGLTLKLARGAVLKSDLQLVKSGDSDSYDKVFNMGLGVMF